MMCCAQNRTGNKLLPSLPNSFHHYLSSGLLQIIASKKMKVCFYNQWLLFNVSKALWNILLVWAIEVQNTIMKVVLKST